MKQFMKKPPMEHNVAAVNKFEEEFFKLSDENKKPHIIKPEYGLKKEP